MINGVALEEFVPQNYFLLVERDSRLENRYPVPLFFAHRLEASTVEDGILKIDLLSLCIHS